MRGTAQLQLLVMQQGRPNSNEHACLSQRAIVRMWDGGELDLSVVGNALDYLGGHDQPCSGYALRGRALTTHMRDQSKVADDEIPTSEGGVDPWSTSQAVGGRLCPRCA